MFFLSFFFFFFSSRRRHTRFDCDWGSDVCSSDLLVEGWLDELLPFQPANDSERSGWLFCLAELARQSGLRAVDVSDHTRDRVLAVLRSNPCPAGWKRMVEEVVQADGEDAARL